LRQFKRQPVPTREISIDPWERKSKRAMAIASALLVHILDTPRPCPILPPKVTDARDVTLIAPRGPHTASSRRVAMHPCANPRPPAPGECSHSVDACGCDRCPRTRRIRQIDRVSVSNTAQRGWAFGRLGRGRPCTPIRVASAERKWGTGSRAFFVRGLRQTRMSRRLRRSAFQP
jgi:hypothetical protein